MKSLFGLKNEVAKQKKFISETRERNYQEIIAAKAAGATRLALKEMEERHSEHADALQWALMEAIKEEREEIKKNEDAEKSQEKERASQEKALKAQALQSWAGNPEDFDDAWPAIHLQILQEQVLKGISDGNAEMNEKRESYSGII